MRATRHLTIVFLVFWLAGAAPALAQVVDKGWFCPADKMSDTCNGKDACDLAWAEHLRTAHGGGGGGGGSHAKTPFPILPALAGLGALSGAGLAYKNSPGDSARMTNNSLSGAGWGAVAAAAVGAARGANPVVVGVVAGSGTYVGMRYLGANRELDGTQDAAKSQKDAVVVGVAAAATFTGLSIANNIAPGLHFPKGLGVSVGRRHFWMRWLW